MSIAISNKNNNNSGKRAALFVMALALAPAAAAAPAGLPKDAAEKRITIELKQADAQNVYRLLADITEVRFVVDECVAHRKIDLALKNAPISLTLDAMAAQLDTTHVFERGTLKARCRGVKPGAQIEMKPRDELEAAPEDTSESAGVDDAARFDKRVSLHMKDADVREVLRAVAAMGGAKLTEAGPLAGKITVDVSNVRYETLLDVVWQSANLDFELRGDELVARPSAAR